MKKISILFLGLVSLALASCTGDYTDWADPQSNAQEGAVTISGFKAGSVATIDLNALDSAQSIVEAFTITKGTLPTGWTYKYCEVQLVPADNETATGYSFVTETGYVEVDALQQMVQETYGAKAVERTFKGTVYAYVQSANGEMVRTNAGQITVTVIPVPSADGKYYIVGNPNGWSTTNCIQNMFICIGDNQYTYTTKWTASYDLKFWPAGSFGDWNNDIWGAGNGDGSESGSLIYGSAAGAFQAPSADYYTLTINMNNQTYKWTKVDTPTKEYSEYGIIGDFNSWGANVDMTPLTGAPHNWYLRYTFTTNTTFKFRGENNWDYNWGATNDVTIDADKYWDTPKAGGNNIGIKAGTYDIYLNDITGQWAAVLVE